MSFVPRLFSHQEKAVNTFFEHDLQKCLLCHPMGSGKTVTVIRIIERLIHNMNVRRVTIAAPLKTRGHWQHHLSFSNAINRSDVIVTVSSYMEALTQAHIVSKRNKSSRKNTVLVVDECHNFHLKPFRPSNKDEDWESYRNASRACMLVRVARQLPYVILVSGTPVLNALSDMRVPYLVLTGQAMTREAHDRAFNIFKTPFPIMREPGEKNNSTERQKKMNLYLTKEDRVALRLVTRKTCCCLPSSVGDGRSVANSERMVELPRVIRCDPPNIRMSTSFFLSYLTKTEPRASNKRDREARDRDAFYVRSRKACNRDDTDEGEHLMDRLSPKLRWLKRSIESWINDNKKARIIVYSHFIDCGILLVTDMLENMNIKYCSITGSSSDEKVVSEVQSFNDDANGEINVMVLSSSASEGLDVKGVEHVVLLEPYWHNARVHQVIARAVRIDPQRKRIDDTNVPVPVHAYLLCLKKPSMQNLRERASKDPKWMKSIRKIIEQSKLPEYGEDLDDELDSERMEEDDDDETDDNLQLLRASLIRPTGDEILKATADKKDAWIQDHFFPSMKDNCVSCDRL